MTSVDFHRFVAAVFNVPSLSGRHVSSALGKGACRRLSETGSCVSEHLWAPHVDDERGILLQRPRLRNTFLSTSSCIESYTLGTGNCNLSLARSCSISLVLNLPLENHRFFFGFEGLGVVAVDDELSMSAMPRAPCVFWNQPNLCWRRDVSRELIGRVAVYRGAGA